MFVRGVIATAGATALLAGAQVNPRRSDLHAVLAFPFLRMFNADDSADVVAGSLGHGSPLYPAVRDETNEIAREVICERVGISQAFLNTLRRRPFWQAFLFDKISRVHREYPSGGRSKDSQNFVTLSKRCPELSLTSRKSDRRIEVSILSFVCMA
jgi:hypothetical protein